MGFDEEYLEDLLKSIEPIVNPNGEVTEGTDPDEIPDMPEEELDSNIAEPGEMEYEEPADTVPASVEETEAGVSDAIEEVEAVSAIPEANPEDGNKMLSPEEIAAMFSAAGASDDAAENVEDEIVAELAGNSEGVAEEMALDEATIDALLASAAEGADAANEEASLEALLAEAGSDTVAETENTEGSGAGDDADELNMSADEIDAMLNAAKDTSGEDGAESDDDLISLLANVGDEDLSDIQSILDSDESGDAVAAAALDATENVEDVASTVLETEKEAKARKKKEKKEAKKQKKSKKAEAGEAAAEGDAEPKKSLLARIIEALTEPVDEDDFGIGDAVIVQTDEKIASEEGMTGISDENKEILEELDNEKGKKKKSKKKKKDKNKKGEEASGDEDGEGEAAEPKKKKKPKKEKKPKAEKVDEFQKPEKRLPRKKVRATFAFCFTIMVAIILAVFGLTKINNLREARWAFDNQDYQTTYDDLYGLEVKGEDEVIFNKSQTILQIERKYTSYQNYQRLGMSYEAVDSLLQAVEIYPAIREKAVTYGIEGQTDYTYSLIVAALQNMGVSEADAKEIVAYDSKVRYTKRVKSIADGTPYTYDDEVAAEGADEVGVSKTPQTVDDILPEENDFLPDDPNSIFDEENNGTEVSDDSSN